MTKRAAKTVRCAVYTRKSTEEGLDRDFNTLDAQREAAENYILSQKQEGWRCCRTRYDDAASACSLLSPMEWTAPPLGSLSAP